jgi:flavodoxin
MKALVIYYSRTGTTKKLAQMISQRLKCDCEEIKSTDSFKGIFGYIRAGRQAFSNTLPSLRSVKRDPAAYDIVILGTPVHASRMAAPVRSFLSSNKGKLKKLAIFATHQGSECESVARGIEDLVGMNAVAQLCVRAAELDAEELKSKIDDFVACILHVSD